MSDYIRKEDVLALLEKYRIELPSTYSAGLTTAKNAVKGMSTEYVAPRTETAREIFAEIGKILDWTITYTPLHMPFNWIEIKFIHYYNELKKEYGVTEE